MAARNNPLINWLNMSFDTFNLFHRWTGRIVVIEAIVHVVAYGLSGTAAKFLASIQSGYQMWGFVVSSTRHYQK